VSELPKWVKGKLDVFFVTEKFHGKYDYRDKYAQRIRRTVTDETAEFLWELFSETVRPTVEFYGDDVFKHTDNEHVFDSECLACIEGGKRARELSVKLWGKK